MFLRGRYVISDKNNGHDPPDADSDFRTLLGQLDNEGGLLPEVEGNPGAAFRRLFDGWVERGGYRRGKPRHAVRQIKVWLGAQQVRSLETKLAGKTFLQRQDASYLLHVFLSHWTYKEREDTYSPYISGGLEDLIRKLLDELFAEGNSALLLPLRSRSSQSQTKKENKEKSSDFFAESKESSKSIEDLFIESDALITVSRARTIIGSDPSHAMEGFHQSISSLHEADTRDKRKRALVWIVDMGLRREDNRARLAIHNLHVLASQFRALALIKSKNSEKRWSWLCDRAVVLVGTLKRSEIDMCYKKNGVNLPKKALDHNWFSGERLFLESVPSSWIGNENLDVFGKSHQYLWRVPTITVHVRLEGWDLNHSPEIDPYRNLRYLFHSVLESRRTGSQPDERLQQDPHCIELNQPGQRWSSGYRVVCNAAFGRLGWSGGDLASSIDPNEALALLREHHFAALRLDEFRTLIDLIIDSEDK